MLNRRYQVLLLVLIGLGIYYPSIFAPVNSIDDYGMFTSLYNTSWSLKDIFTLFIPKGEGGLYYRPLLYLTFIFDKEFWFLEESFMHLENILFHLLNMLLVFWYARQIQGEEDSKNRYLPFIAAIAFGLHPVNTESVNWISGRTDLMAATFVLLSANYLVKFKKTDAKRFISLSALCFFLGLLCKEVALAFLAGAFFMMTARDSVDTSQKTGEGGKRPTLRNIVMSSILVVGAALSFFFLRSLAFTSNSGKIGMTLKFIFNEPVHALFVFLGAFGFYVKKLFYPFPLNFAIIDIDPLYELFAIPIVILCLYIASRRSLISATFTAGIFLITPTFPIAYRQIAWTPYAERYIYMASAFIIISSVIYLGELFRKIPSRYAAPVLAGVVLLTMAATTLTRNVVWQSNLTLYEDTVQKTPNFGKIRNEYAIALAKNKDYHNASIQCSIANSLADLEYVENPDLNAASILAAEGKTSEAIKKYESVLDKTKWSSPKTLDFLIRLVEKAAISAKDPAEILSLNKNLFNYNKKLYELNKSPYTLYKLGQISLILGDRKAALRYFRSAYVEFPEGDEFKVYAKKVVARLEKE